MKSRSTHTPLSPQMGGSNPPRAAGGCFAMKPSELLIGARDYLMEYGWCPRGLKRGETVCAIGALAKADGWQNGKMHLDWSREGYRAAEILRSVVGSIPVWNNSAGRTFNEIMDGFDRAIILAKEQESVKVREVLFADRGSNA